MAYRDHPGSGRGQHHGHGNTAFLDDEELSISLSQTQLSKRSRAEPSGSNRAATGTGPGTGSGTGPGAGGSSSGRHHQPSSSSTTSRPTSSGQNHQYSTGPPSSTSKMPPTAARPGGPSATQHVGSTDNGSSNTSKIRNDQRISAYDISKTLGEGSFGKVKLATHKGTKQKVALKIISRKRLASTDMAGRVEREIEYLQLLRHPHIIKLFTVIKTDNEIIMVLEYAGGELFDHIVQHGKLSENEARRFFQQMLCAVEYCHRHKIVHRDLKPENLLLDENLNVKIADFGLSNIMTDGNFLKTSCGSPNYAAPEVISGKLYAGSEVDVWSCGVILYVLLVGRLPFDDDHIPSLFAKIARGTYVVPSWMSPGAAGLIKKMLVVNPVNRATIAEIRQDPWFMTNLPDYLQLPIEPFFNTGIDPEKAIRPSDTAPNAPPRVQEKLHAEVTDKISKTMGYGKQDVLEALEAEEPSAIKDAYMIVRENKLMQGNPALGADNPFFAASPPTEGASVHAGLTSMMEASSIGGHSSGTTGGVDPGASPMASMSSARSATSSVAGASVTSSGVLGAAVAAVSARPYTTKIGILPSSLPAYHRAYMDNAAAAQEAALASAAYITIDVGDGVSSGVVEPPAPARTPAEQEETSRRLRPHARSSQTNLTDGSTGARPQGMTPSHHAGSGTRRSKAVRWQFGIRSRNAPFEALLCIYKALRKLGAGWLADRNYAMAMAHAAGEDVVRLETKRRQAGGGGALGDLGTPYELPADPWHIKARWETGKLRRHSDVHDRQFWGDNKNTASVKGRDERGDEHDYQVVAMRLSIQIYEMESGVYLVDFKCAGYELPDGRILEEKDVTSPFPFLDLAARLIMQLADAD